jgi:hypothetical protein
MKLKDLYYHADDILGPGKTIRLELQNERESDIMIMVVTRWKRQHPEAHIMIDYTKDESL